MEYQNKKRRLAAILFADIAGYTAMMQKDEMLAASLLHKFHSTMKSEVPQFNGQVVQFFGDGCLSIFDSSVDAIHCSITIQKICKADPYVPLRIGLHSGDIYFTADNAFGDSINITSRIESMGVPGAILVSKKMQEEVKNQASIKLVSLGNFDYKHVDDSLEVFAVANEGIIVPNASQLKGKFKEVPKNKKTSPLLILSLIVLGVLLIGFFGKSLLKNKVSVSNENIAVTSQSIAVLPFEIENDQSGREYFTSVLADEIRGTLAQIKQLKVISRSSCEFYKNQNLPLSKIGDTLGVSHILTSRAYWEGNILKVVAELNDALKDEMIWTKSYEVNMQQLPQLKLQIASDLAKVIKLELTEELKAAFATDKVPLANLYEKWLKARHNLEDYTPEKMAIAYQLAREIVQEDSTYANAYYILGYHHLIHAVWFGSKDPATDMKKSKIFFDTGLKYDPKNGLCLAGLSNYYLFYEWNFVKAEEEIQKSISLGEQRGYLSSVIIKFYNGEFDEAEKRLNKLKEIDPLSIYHDYILGRVWFFQGKTERAKKILKDGIGFFDLIDYYHSLGKIYLNTNDYQSAVSTLEKGLNKAINRIHPPIMADLALAYHQLGQKDKSLEIEKSLESIYKKGEGGSPAFFLAQIASGKNEKDKAFDWLDKAFHHRETEMVWLKIEPQFLSLRSDKRYSELISKMSFPTKLIN